MLLYLYPCSVYESRTMAEAKDRRGLQRKTSVIQVRVTLEVKRRLAKMARSRGLPLSSWVVSVALREC